MGPGAMGSVGGGVRGGWGWGLEVWVGGGGGWGLGVAGAYGMGVGVGGCRGHIKDQHWQPCRSRDAEWDQEPMGPGAMGPVGGRGAWGVGVGVGSVERVGCVVILKG